MTISVKARVVGVRPRGDDTFAITLGPGPNIFWLRTSKPPKLGEYLHVIEAEATRIRVPGGGAVTMLEGGELEVIPDRYTRRVVAPAWVKRVHNMVRRPLLPHQAEGAGWLASRLANKQGAILGDDPGLGKTAQVLAAIVATGMTPAIVVCPPSVKLTWASEVKYMKPHLRVAVIDGGKGPIPSAHIIIVNYDILRTRERQLLGLRARCIVFDEAHFLKEPRATPGHRAAVATRMAHRIGRCIEMTGTVLLNRPEEMWRLLHNVDPRAWRKFSDFRERYCTKPGEGEENVRSMVTKHGKAKHIDELHALVGPYMLRRTREGTLGHSLPKKTRVRVLVDLEAFDREHYKRAEKDVVAWLKDVASNDRAAQAKRGQAVVKLTMLRRIAALGKLRVAVRNYLKAWFDANDRQLVIFAYHIPVLDGTAFICRRLGLKVARIKGSDSTKKRQASIDLFRGGFADVFIAPIKSAGCGVDGLQCASDVLFLERLWTPSLMNQAESRCHRMGQTRPVTVTYLDAVDTVDEYIAKVLLVKQQLIDMVVDDCRQPVQYDETIATIDEVIQQIAHPPMVAQQAG